MDKTTLVDTDVRDGSRLLLALRKTGMPIEAAMWLRLEDDVYKLHIVTPLVQDQGPIKTYMKIRDVINGMLERESITFEDILVSNTIDDLPNYILSFVSLGGSELLKLSNFRIEDLLIKDAVIYEVDPVGSARHPVRRGAKPLGQQKEDGSSATRTHRRERA